MTMAGGGFTWRHVLYRLFDAGGRLLYVGITQDINERFGDHRRDKPWWPDVVDVRVEFHDDQEALEAAEAVAIASEGPLYNRYAGKGRGKTLVTMRLDDATILLVRMLAAQEHDGNFSEAARALLWEGLGNYRATGNGEDAELVRNAA